MNNNKNKYPNVFMMQGPVDLKKYGLVNNDIKTMTKNASVEKTNNEILAEQRQERRNEIMSELSNKQKLIKLGQIDYGDEYDVLDNPFMHEETEDDINDVLPEEEPGLTEELVDAILRLTPDKQEEVIRSVAEARGVLPEDIIKMISSYNSDIGDGFDFIDGDIF